MSPAEKPWTDPRNRSDEPTERERELLRKAIRDAQPPLAGRAVISWPEAFVLVAIFAAVVAIVAIIA